MESRAFFGKIVLKVQAHKYALPNHGLNLEQYTTAKLTLPK